MSMQPGIEHAETVRTEHQGDIAVIVVDNPPVNAIAPSVRDGIYAAVLAVALWMTIDLDHPRQGTIQLSIRPLVDTLAGMK